MRALLIAALLFGGSAVVQAAAPTAAPAAVPNTVVNFVHPEKFLDASDVAFGNRPSERVLDQIRRIFVALGAKYLGPNQHLTIDVTDVDLAGRFESALQTGSQVRVLRNNDWPRITLHYTLKEHDVVVQQADARIADMSYLNHQLPGRPSESFAYERRMLDSWFAQTFKRGS